MLDMNRHKGTAITEEIEDIRQSVNDILMTRIGSRVMRRDYGSMLPELIDQPLNNATLLRAYSAAIISLLTWEPRIKVNAIRQNVSSETPGLAEMELVAVTTKNQQPVRIDVRANLVRTV